MAISFYEFGFIVNQNNFDKNGMLQLALNWPEKSIFDCSNTKIIDDNTNYLAAIIKNDDGKLPDGCYLDLSNNEITDIGFITILKALTSLKAPKNLSLNFANNRITETGFLALLELLTDKACPKGLHVDLGALALSIDNNKKLFDAIRHKSINEASINIRPILRVDDDLKILSHIRSGNIIPGTFIDLLIDHQFQDTVGDFHIKERKVSASQKGLFKLKTLLDALKTDDAPKDVTIQIRSIGEFDETPIINAIKGNRLPLGIKFDFNNLPFKESKYLINALKCNTSITEFDYPLPSVLLKDIIYLCCTRNKLLRKYPEQADFIKSISHKQGMYISSENLDEHFPENEIQLEIRRQLYPPFNHLVDGISGQVDYGTPLDPLITAIQYLQIKGHDTNTLDALKNFYYNLMDKYYEHEDLKDTCYPILIEHFTKLAFRLCDTKQPISYEEVDESSKVLEHKLAAKPPMNPRLKVAVCGVIGAVVGFTLGITVGAIVSVWAGGIGALPGAILGAVKGFTLGTAFGLTGGTLGGIGTSPFGFYNHKEKRKRYEQQQLFPELKAKAIDTMNEIRDAHQLKK